MPEDLVEMRYQNYLKRFNDIVRSVAKERNRVRDAKDGKLLAASLGRIDKVTMFRPPS